MRNATVDLREKINWLSKLLNGKRKIERKTTETLQI